jgi:hypothetical protein
LTFEKIIPLSEHIKKDHPGDLERKYYPCFHCKQIFLTPERQVKDFKDHCGKRKKKADENYIKNGSLGKIAFLTRRYIYNTIFFFFTLKILRFRAKAAIISILTKRSVIVM